MGFSELFNRAKAKAQDPELQEKLKEAARKAQANRQQRAPVAPVRSAPNYGSGFPSFDPTGSTGSGDLDGDGVPDYLEQQGFDPFGQSNDFDGDGIPDDLQSDAYGSPYDPQIDDVDYGDEEPLAEYDGGYDSDDSSY